MDKKSAFTLAEVLITLAIIGVVAVLTVPNLLQKHQVSETVDGVSKAYATLSQALKLAENENGKIETWDILPNSNIIGEEKVVNIITPYLKVKELCAHNKGCFADTYKGLSGNNKYGIGNYKVLLEDGSAMAFHSQGCDFTLGNINNCVSVNVDINGPKGPNRGCVDLFNFHLTPNGVVAAGGKGYKNQWSGTCENITNTTIGNGCTAWVLYKKNMDYLKHPISWDN